MARARSLKPSIFKNEILGTADPLYTILFECLWCLADREGRLEDRPMRIKIEAFPYRDNIDMDAMLQWLADHKFIIRYSVGEEKYIQIINFRKHQNPHVKEHASTIPAPGSNGSVTGNTGTSRADSLNPITDSLNPVTTPSALNEKISFSAQHGWSGLNGYRDNWKKAYPAIDIEVELEKARAWLIANPKNKKSNYARFLTNWFSRSQDRAPRMVSGRTPPAGKMARAAEALRRSNGTAADSATANDRGTGALPHAGPPARLRTERG